MLGSSDDLFPPAAQDLAAFRRERARKAPARLRYVIWFTPRSGSSWLTDIATASGRLSQPGECFNPDFMPEMTRNARAATMDQYIQILSRRRNTYGVFGVQITWHQMQRSFDGADRFMRYFDGSPAIWLIREDIVMQAVSLAKKEQTRIGHSVQSSAEARAAADAQVSYDADLIAFFLRSLHRAEQGTEEIFADYGLTPLRLSYERNMAMGGSHVLNAMAHHLKVKPIPHGAGDQSDHVQIRTELNAAFADRFRAEHAAMLDEIAGERAARLEAVDRTLPERLPARYREPGTLAEG
jgi:LPS sulfotransferase NodH